MVINISEGVCALIRGEVPHFDLRNRGNAMFSTAHRNKCLTTDDMKGAHSAFLMANKVLSSLPRPRGQIPNMNRPISAASSDVNVSAGDCERGYERSRFQTKSLFCDTALHVPLRHCTSKRLLPLLRSQKDGPGARHNDGSHREIDPLDLVHDLRWPLGSNLPKLVKLPQRPREGPHGILPELRSEILVPLHPRQEIPRASAKLVASPVPLVDDLLRRVVRGGRHSGQRPETPVRRNESTHRTGVVAQGE
mmetsp:Transcript_62559/g.185020  ORF Transcript_62559/g.185020 Transcript_62559/m.185020 type:complete len:250 (+) Transcript_62559:347-1096(+)